jgi:exonuclease III
MIIINQQNADVIMVTETWLTDAIPDEALHIPDFTIVRKDRPTRRRGGVAVYIRESLPFKIRPDFHNSDYECLWIILSNQNGFHEKFQNLRLRVYTCHRR